MDFVLEYYLNWVISSPCGKLYRRSLIDTKGFDEKISLGEDLKFNIQYFENTNSIMVLHDTLYLYYDTPASLTKSYKANNYEAQLDIYVTAKKYIHSVNRGDQNYKNFRNINYKLFNSCVSFLSQNMKYGCTYHKQVNFIKKVVFECNLQNAIESLPDISCVHKLYRFAIRNRCTTILYVLSFVKYMFFDKLRSK